MHHTDQTGSRSTWGTFRDRAKGSSERGATAGHGLHTVVVDDLDERVESMSARGIEPISRETFRNRVGKVIYRDPDGNEVGFGGAPLE